MVAVRRMITALAVAALALTAAPNTGDAHPLHTTLAEVTVDASRRTVRATVRLFADDLSAALAKSAPGSGGLDARAAAYVASAFSLTADGLPVVLRSCGVHRTGDLLWVCLEGASPAVGGRLRARDPLLTEAFPDQINIVQVGAGRRSVVFLKGDRDKPLDD